MPYNYGINLAFKPVVLSSGRISLEIKTNVSEPAAVRLGNAADLPAPLGRDLRRASLRRLDRACRPDPGQRFADDRTARRASTRFRFSARCSASRTVERDETELVIIATPYLVRPVARNELNRPDDNFSPENDAAGLLPEPREQGLRTARGTGRRRAVPRLHRIHLQVNGAGSATMATDTENQAMAHRMRRHRHESDGAMLAAAAVLAAAMLSGCAGPRDSLTTGGIPDDYRQPAIRSWWPRPNRRLIFRSPRPIGA